jgi:uncharacterized lipoprotein YddW (UPF0748 family)
MDTRSRPACRPRPSALRIALLVCLALCLLPRAPAAHAADQPAEQMRAFWVDALNPGFRNHPQVDELVANALRANANTIFVQMRRHGDARYNNSVEPRAADPQLAPAGEFDPLAYLLEKAHLHGVAVHAWLVMSVACRDTDPLRGHPSHLCTAHGPNSGGAERWTTATYRGSQVGDLDFGHPEAVRYTERVVLHLLRNYPALDGIHYDYIRFGGADYGYNQVSVERFNHATGRPLDQRPAPDDPAWSQWRRDRVTELVRRLYVRIKALNPRIQVSAATITWGGLGSYHPDDWPNSAAYSRVFQDWRAWLEEGILDFAVPMHYFAEGDAQTRGWYDGWLAWDRDHAGRRAIVAGVGAWLNNGDQNIAQIARALSPDAEGRALAGVSLFSYHFPHTSDDSEQRRALMDALRGSVFAQPARAPVWPWIANPTTGHLQAIAAVDGLPTPDAHVSLFREGVWQRDLSASFDGWFGAVDLEPGSYTALVRSPAGGRTAEIALEVLPGLVASGP